MIDRRQAIARSRTGFRRSSPCSDTCLRELEPPTKPSPDRRTGACATRRSRWCLTASLSQLDVAYRGADAFVFEVQISQRRARQQGMEAWLRRSGSQSCIILGRQDHDRVLAVHRHTLWPSRPGLSHHLAEMSLGVLKLPNGQRVSHGRRRSPERVRICQRLPHVHIQSVQYSQITGVCSLRQDPARVDWLTGPAAATKDEAVSAAAQRRYSLG